MAEFGMTSAVLPFDGKGLRSSAWWGMLCLIATEAILFVYLIFAYAYLGAQTTGPWPPDGPPSLRLALPDTLVLLGSSIILEWGRRVSKRRGAQGLLRIAVAVTFVMGGIFVAIQCVEWHGKPFKLAANDYAAAYFTMTGVHMAHVAVGLVVLAALFAWSFMGRLQGRGQHVELGVLYWHFVDAVWVIVFLTLYLVPRLS